MRLKVALILAIMLSITAIASANETVLNAGSALVANDSDPAAWYMSPTGEQISVKLERVDGTTIPFGPLAGSGNQSCSNDLPSIGIDDTGATIVPPTFLAYDETDPVLSCRWGSPHRGYRTVWYRLSANRTTLVAIDTAGSTYDTVLGVHAVGDIDGACSTLTEVACNDDHNRFTSRVTVPVRAGETYYIQVGDYHAAYQGDENGNDNTLFVTAIPTPIDSRWEMVDNDPANPAAQRSRHVAVAVDDKIYVIGGQIGIGENMVNTPSNVVFDSSNPDPSAAWRTLQSMPPTEFNGGYGYSHTTAAIVNNRIYIPSGYFGIPGSYDGTHIYYDIEQDRWNITNPSSNNWVDDQPSILATAVPYPWLGFDGYFLVGGLTGLIPAENTTGFEARDETYFYAAGANLWFNVPSTLNRGRFGHVAAQQVLDNTDRICVAGGFGKEDAIIPELGPRELLASTECLDIDAGNWVTLSSADLNYPRVYAGSSVNKYGDWYIYGGFDGDNRAVSAVEKFNRETKEWEVLNVRFDLGAVSLRDKDEFSRPARLFPRGDFVDANLWVFGGETINQEIVNLIEKARLPITVELPSAEKTYLPLTAYQFNSPLVTDDTFVTAKELRLNAAQTDRFEGVDDFADVFYLDLLAYQQVTIEVSQLPANSNYKLELYTDEKDARPPVISSIGQTKLVETRSLEAGRYYIILIKDVPPPATNPFTPPYVIVVRS